jgi:hypothetical protein
MNTNESTALDTDLLAEWATATREVFRLGSQPIQDGDPRRVELASHFGPKTEEVTALMTPAEVGDLYATNCGIWPVWNQPLPAWAVSATVLPGDYPDVTVRLAGQEWPVGVWSVRTEQLVYVNMRTPVAEATVSPVEINTGDECYSLQTAMDLSIAIEDAFVDYKHSDN